MLGTVERCMVCAPWPAYVMSCNSSNHKHGPHDLPIVVVVVVVVVVKVVVVVVVVVVVPHSALADPP